MGFSGKGLRIGFAGIVVWIMLSGLSIAQEVEIPDDLKDDTRLSRQERIRRHEKRVQIILQTRLKAKAEEKKRKLEEETRRRAERYSRHKEPRTAPSEKSPESLSTVTSFSPASSQILAHTILYFYPFDKAVIIGKNFLTDMEIYNLVRAGIDEMWVSITYDPRFIAPILINDNEIHPLIDGSPVFKVDTENGEIFYSCKFQNPQSLEGKSILRIVWKPIKPTDYCEISFDLSENRTALISDGKNILGNPNSTEDGIIPTGIAIRPSSTKGQDKFQIDPAFESAFGKKLPAEQPGYITLRLECLAHSARVGETFDVSVFISNPDAEIFDNVGLWIRYDPEILKVVDWDRRNWISEGINIQDGFARKKYPFNYHLRNEANNYTGAIDYRMGISQIISLPTGELARIRFRALASVQKTEIYFAHRGNSRFPNTSITSMGQELLDPRQWQERNLRGTTIHITEH